MKKLLSILICMSMVLSLVCVSVSASSAEAFAPAEEFYFENFNTALETGASEIFEQSANSGRKGYFPTFARENGKLKVTKGTAQYGTFKIPSSALKTAGSAATKFVVEWDMTISTAYARAQISFDASTYTGGSGNTAVTGKYYGIFDSEAKTVTVYRDGTSIGTASNVTANSDDNGISVELTQGTYADTSYNLYDYIAVYALEDSFDCELSDVKSTGAILKTNMPINEASTALTIDGDNQVTVTKVGDTYNEYKLTFATPLGSGSYNLSGTVSELATGTSTAVDIDFDYTFVFEKAEALYFNDFSVSGAEDIVKDTDGNFPTVACEGGYLTITRSTAMATGNNGSNTNWAHFVLPSNVINSASSTATKFVIEFDVDMNNSTNNIAVSINGSNNKNSVNAPDGKYYIIYDSSVKSFSIYDPNGGVAAQASVPTGDTNGFNLRFRMQLNNNAANNHKFDYIAVYPLNSTFDGAVENVNTKTATLKTNMPLDLTASTFMVDRVEATAVATDNTYNEYTLTFGSEIAKGDHTLAVSAVQLGSSESQPKSLAFNCSEDAPADPTAGYYNDFETSSKTTDFTSSSLVGRLQKMIVTAGQLELTDQSESTNWAEFKLPANKINAAFSNADKFVIQWNASYTSDMACQQIAINGEAWAGVWYNNQNEALKNVPEGTYTVIYDRANNSASYYYPGCTEPVAIANIPAATAAEGFDVYFKTITYLGDACYDYITVYPLEGDFEYSVSNVTENKALLTTNQPIDIATAVIKIGGVACTAENLPTEPNKYILTPASALTVGTEAAVTVETLKLIDGTELTPAAHAAVTPAAGSTVITGIEIITDEADKKVAKITGTNNIVGAAPVVIVAEYADADASLLSFVDYENAILPLGEFDGAANGVTLAPSGDEGTSHRAFIFESLNSLKPMK